MTQTLQSIATSPASAFLDIETPSRRDSAKRRAPTPTHFPDIYTNHVVEL